ncbi:MAG: YraN family protein [Bacteroidota bacterium]
MNNADLGTFGEQLACDFIRKKKYQIIDRNYRFKKNEIDIVAKKDNKLIIIEVKTRQTSEIGEPWQAVSKQKQKQVIKVANHYVQNNNIELETRFDIISIIHNSFITELIHIEEAFYPRW